jgi:hypothetical protein
MNEPEAKPDISLTQRYASAWAEIAQRISARQSVYLQFATVIVTAIVGLLGAWIKSRGENSLLLGGVAEWGGSIGLTVYTAVFARWIRHNDALIGLLGVFCKTLEQCDDDCTRPAWHVESEGWMVLAREYRKNSDWAAAALAGLVCLLIAFFVVVHLRNCEMLQAGGLFAVFILEVWTLIFLLQSASFREEIASYTRQTVLDKAARLRKSS